MQRDVHRPKVYKWADRKKLNFLPDGRLTEPFVTSLRLETLYSSINYRFLYDLVRIAVS